jgi:phenylalanyl-tRNA synthetase beta chain
MRLSFEWLREYVPIDITPAAVADHLTMAGLEVEEVEAWGEHFESVIVGRLVEITPHPGGGRLLVCRVDVGTEVLTIVCGAHNIAVGDHVPVALVGASLPMGKRIVAEPIAGVVSQGMLCSAAELGFTDTSEGIFLLSSRSRVGESLASELDLRDVILEVNVTPNRPDCLNIFGIAREVAAITGVPLKAPDLHVPQTDEPITSCSAVTVEAPDLCPRFAARYISGVQVGSAPLWLQRRLLACGLRPHNNVVDATNYLMLELGHPLHAYDYHTLSEGHIVVRVAHPGEVCVTLDGLSRTLDPSVLVIADAEHAVGIAGIMGGHNTEIRATTIRILLESAYFQPQNIRRTSKTLALRTEASYRFERGADFDGLVPSLDRCAALIATLSGGQVAAGRLDVAARRYEAPQISVRVTRVNQVLGVELTSDTIAHYCTRLQLPVSTRTTAEVEVEAPSFRRDLAREIDIIEEVGRLHSFQAIDTALPQVRLEPVPRLPQREVARRVLDLLIGCGYTQVVNYTFMNEEDLDRLQLPTDDPLRRVVSLRNPLSKEAGVLRTTLVPSLLRTIATNLHREMRDLMLYESSKVFRRQNGLLPHEPHMLGLTVTGKLGGQHWGQPARTLDFYDVLGALELITERLGVPRLRVTAAAVPYCHPGKSATLSLGDDPLGVVGEVHPRVLAAFDLSQAVILAEIDFDRLLNAGLQTPRYRQIPRFPSVTRDLSIVVDAAVEAGHILALIDTAQPDLLRTVRLFDVYAGTPVPEGKKSLTFALTYRADDRTLTDEEVNGMQARVIERLSQTFGAQLRGQEGV